MSQHQNIEDLKHIRNIMERSSKFTFLSGLSAISAGLSALLGAVVAYFLIFQQGNLQYDEHIRSLGAEGNTWSIRLQMAILAILILVCAAGTALYFSSQKARKQGARLWTGTAKRTFYHFMIPLVTGGVFCIALAVTNNIHLIASATLVFYGLALVNAGKFTLNEIHYLGLSEIAVGLLAGFFLDYGLLFWVLGFGILHIIYGMIIYCKYDQKTKVHKAE